jgi:hypothetical protein
MSAQARDLTIRLGEPFGPEELSLTNPDGSPTNLSGVSLTLVVRELEGAADLLAVGLGVNEPPSAGKATLPAIPVSGPQSVANLAAFAERVLRYKVLDGSGNQVAGGWVYVAPQWGSV